MHKVQMEVEIDDQFLADILITAIEGGIGYWSEAVTYTWTEGPEHVRAEIIVTETDESETDDRLKGHKTINTQTILNGISTLLNGGVKINKEIMGYILSGVRESDAGYIDSDGADAIVQAGLFHEIIFG